MRFSYELHVLTRLLLALLCMYFLDYFSANITLLNLGASVEIAMSFCYKTAVNVIAVVNWKAAKNQ